MCHLVTHFCRVVSFLPAGGKHPRCPTRTPIPSLPLARGALRPPVLRAFSFWAGPAHHTRERTDRRASRIPRRSTIPLFAATGTRDHRVTAGRAGRARVHHHGRPLRSRRRLPGGSGLRSPARTGNRRSVSLPSPAAPPALSCTGNAMHSRCTTSWARCLSAVRGTVDAGHVRNSADRRGGVRSCARAVSVV